MRVNEANIFYSAFNQRRITFSLKITQLLFARSTQNLVKFSMFEANFNSVLYQRLHTFAAVMDDAVPVKVQIN